MARMTLHAEDRAAIVQRIRRNLIVDEAISAIVDEALNEAITLAYDHGWADGSDYGQEVHSE